MALSTTGNYDTVVHYIFWWIEVTTGKSVGNYNQDGSVQVSPWVYDILRLGYVPQDTGGFGPSTSYEMSDGTVVQAWPVSQSTAEAADQADLLTLITSYLAYKHTRLGHDTNVVTVPLG